jgi:hypothetical protein
MAGDTKLRDLFERSLSIKIATWEDGFMVLADKVEAPDFIGWLSEPERMAVEALRFGNVLVADMLRNNPLLDFYREEMPGGSVASTLHLFDSGHPFNILNSAVGTFNNDWAAGATPGGDVEGTIPSTINTLLLEQLDQHFGSILGPNGRPLGLSLGGLLVPRRWKQVCRKLFEHDTVVRAVQNVLSTENVGGVTQNNIYSGYTYKVADELTGTLPSGLTGDVDTIYAFATRQGEAPPPAYVLQDGGTPEEIVYDKTDPQYKDAAKIGLKRRLKMSATAALPHGIVRVNLSPS